MIYAILREKRQEGVFWRKSPKGGDWFYFGERSSIKIELSYCMEDDGSDGCYKPFCMKM